MASRLGQRLLRSKSKAENFGLFTLYFSYFYYLLFGCPTANFWLLSSKQSHSPNVNHCIWAISFWSRAEMEGVGSLHLSECPVSFDHKAITPQIAGNTLPRFKPSFPKCENAPNTQNRYNLTLWRPLGLQNTSLDAKFRVQNFSFLLINQWLKVPGSTASLNLDNAQIRQKVYNSTHN